MRLPVLLSALFSLALAAPLRAEVATEMTPEVLQEAVDLGMREDVGRYNASTPVVVVSFDTPFRRVAMAAAAARKRDEALDVKTVPASLTAPDVQITVQPLPINPVRIKTVMAQVGSEPPVALSEIKPLLDKVQTGKKKHIEMRGVSGKLPLSVLRPGLKLRLLLDEGPEQVIEPKAELLSSVR